MKITAGFGELLRQIIEEAVDLLFGFEHRPAFILAVPINAPFQRAEIHDAIADHAEIGFILDLLRHGSGVRDQAVNLLHQIGEVRIQNLGDGRFIVAENLVDHARAGGRFFHRHASFSLGS